MQRNAFERDQVLQCCLHTEFIATYAPSSGFDEWGNVRWSHNVLCIISLMSESLFFIRVMKLSNLHQHTGYNLYETNFEATVLHK